MVTQIYTAPIKAHYTPPPGMGGAAIARQPVDTATSDEGGNRKGGMLAAVDDQNKQGVISVQSILTDFQSTMDALGVTDHVRQEVAPYLQVVAHQANQDQPVTGLMKQNLKVAAGTLDQFITGALGQKSDVVKEWVDALLTQPIAFHSDTPVTVNTGFAKGVFQTAGGAAQIEGGSGGDLPFAGASPALPVSLSSADRQWVKNTLTDAKAALATHPQAALDSYSQILDKVKDQKDCQALTAKVTFQSGRCQQALDQPDAARASYLNAESLAGDDTRLKARCQGALGRMALSSGEPSEATRRYQQVLDYQTQSGDLKGQSATLQQLGRIAVRTGDTDAAKTYLTSALDKAKTANPALVPDVLSGLGVLARKAGQPKEAFGYFKDALASAQALGDPEVTKQSLTRIAGLYLDAGKPDKALKALQSAFV